MARVPFSVERGLRVTGENAATGVHYLFGSGVPGADSGLQDGAEVGSVYQRTDTPSMYIKIASANLATDWSKITTAADLVALGWRAERVIAATGLAAPSSGTVIDLVAVPFSDDAAPTLVAADFIVGDHIIFGVGATEVLMRVSVVSGDEITVVTAAYPLADNDTFLVRYYLPDGPDAQEKQAIVTYNGTSIVKIGDFNWDLATGINLSGAYSGAGANALPAAADSVEVAIQKLDANERDLTTLSGMAIGSVDNGTFTGDIIPDNSTTKGALQSLETELVDTRQNVDDLITLSGVAENATNLGTFTGYTIPDNSTNKAALQALETGLEARSQISAVTTITTLDSVLVDNILGCEWEVHVREDATPANVHMFKVLAVHNGTASADATTTDNTLFSKLKLGSNFNLTVTIDLNGTTTAQVMRLRITSSSAGVTATARRIEVR